MKSAPESHRRKPRCVRQPFDRKINSGFLRHQIDVRENRDPRGEVFENLSAPTRLCARIVPFPFLKSESQEELDQICEKTTGRSEGMMIMVTPTQAQRILSPLLDSARAVARFPVRALFREEEIAGNVWTD